MQEKNFTYDYVAKDSATQKEIFEDVVQPIADYCMQGYNGTIFAYGQTGTGKTYTIQGPSTKINGIETIITSKNSDA